jgi:hypothetical protein
MPDGKETAYLHLAAPIYEWRWMDKETFQEVDQFLARGGRLVITLFPQSTTSFRSRYEDEAETNSVPKKVENPKDEKKADDKKPDSGEPRRKRTKKGFERELDSQTISIKDRWGLEFRINNLKEGDNDAFEPALLGPKGPTYICPPCKTLFDQ